MYVKYIVCQYISIFFTNISILFSIFRLEITLPKRWFKSLHSLGDHIFQLKIFNRTLDSSLHPYDIAHKESDAIDYEKKLEIMPQRELIKRILQLEEKNNGCNRGDVIEV